MTILINHLGYYSGEQKIGKVIGSKTIIHFNVFDIKNNLVLAGKSSIPIFDSDTNEFVSDIDFTNIEEFGDYYILINDIKSSVFSINKIVYDDLENSLIYMLHMQKCGSTVIDTKYNTFSHESCHTKLAKIYGKDEYLDVSGGYHDAGDYGRYITPGAKMIMELLLAYEINKDEELLKIAKYELDFFKKMMREDGAVYHKVTGYNFSGMIMPDEHKNDLVISPISTTATADFAAVMAFASTIIPEKKEEYLNLAKLSYNFIENNHNIPFYNPKDITTGQYEDDKSIDEIYFAKMSLYNSTNDIYYLNDINSYLPKTIDEFLGLGWEEMSLFGTYIFLRNSNNTKLAIYDKLSKDFRNNLDVLVQRSITNPFNITLENYPWGSNAYLMNNANAIHFGYLIYQEKKYLELSSKLINYILGTNSLNMTFVTGYGLNSPIYPHHRPSVSKGIPLTGMLVGGPAEGLFDDTIKELKSNEPKAKIYIDHTLSFSTNEICIYWNSPFLLALVLLKYSYK